MKQRHTLIIRARYNGYTIKPTHKGKWEDVPQETWVEIPEEYITW